MVDGAQGKFSTMVMIHRMAKRLLLANHKKQAALKDSGGGGGKVAGARVVVTKTKPGSAAYLSFKLDREGGGVLIGRVCVPAAITTSVEKLQGRRDANLVQVRPPLSVLVPAVSVLVPARGPLGTFCSWYLRE